MSEHWKSTPRYWCKHCSCYVRDTKLEKQNHESTAKHQNAIKRSLRDLHRNHEREEREKERAKREIDRLNNVVNGSATASTSTSQIGRAWDSSSKSAPSAEAELKRQREQLVEMGVAIPSSFRPEMALPGEWTVTNMRVIETSDEPNPSAEAKAVGVRKREVTEDDKEEEDAVRGLFKKSRKWGRDPRLASQSDDTELDALLRGPLPLQKKEEDEKKEKKEEEAESVAGISLNEPETPNQGGKTTIKNEDGEAALRTEGVADLEKAVKSEDDGAPPIAVKTEGEDADAGASSSTNTAPVMFKKRKPKGIRQK